MTTARAPLPAGAIAAVLARAAAANRRLKCFIDLDPAGAGAAAGASGPLQGLTGAIKGNIAMAGLANTGGSASRRAAVATVDAGAVARLRAAGACLIGTANLHEGALGATTRNEAFGWCENPWRAGHTSGGSSGGSAAAVSAGLVDFALGSDTMGSIRIPAAYCGVYGFKPSGHWLEQDGVIPLKAGFDQIGPIARDAATLLKVAGALGGPAPQPIAGARIGILQGWEELPPGLAAVVTDATERLLEAGASLVPVRLPSDLDPAAVLRAGFVACAREAGLQHWAADYADPASGLSDGFRTQMSFGLRASTTQLEAGAALIDKLRGALHALFADHRLDAIASPTAPETAFAHTVKAPRQAGLTCLANFAGLPALSAPAGLLEGLPVGLQLIGARGGDGLVLGAAELFEALPLPEAWW